MGSVLLSFTSRVTQASLVFGKLSARQSLVVRSYGPEGGVTFSDGAEGDYLSFNASVVATVGLAERKARLVVKSEG